MVDNRGNSVPTWHKSSLFVLPQRMQLREATVSDVEHELLLQLVGIVFLYIVFVLVGSVSSG